MSTPRIIPVMLGAVSPLALLAACTSDVVDLGNDGLVQGLERSTQCTESPIVRGPVEIKSQAELEALSGCEEVRGDLHIRVYDGTDLTPLAALRAVSGRFTLGESSETTAENQDDGVDAEAVRQQVVEAGWLTSLQGVESLERVGSLEIQGIAAPDLRAFASLRNLAGNDDPVYSGRLSIRGARALVNLAGLENATGVADLFIQDNAALESLFGLRVSSEVPRFVSLLDNPRLTDLFALAPLEITRFLFIERCGVVNLDALRGFAHADRVEVRENPELVEMFGIADATFGELVVERNPMLVGVPSFVNGRSNSRVRFIGNAVLESLSFAFTTAFGSVIFEDRELFIGNDWFEISDNPRLQLLEIENSPAGILSGQLFAVHRNASLLRVDLGSLRALDLLSIVDNTALNEVVLGSLTQADHVTVTGNPQLDATALRAVPTFQGTFGGNANEPPLAP